MVRISRLKQIVKEMIYSLDKESIGQAMFDSLSSFVAGVFDPQKAKIFDDAVIEKEGRFYLPVEDAATVWQKINARPKPKFK